MIDEGKLREVLGVMREDEVCAVRLTERKHYIEIQAFAPAGQPCMITPDMALKLAGQLRRLAGRIQVWRGDPHE